MRAEPASSDAAEGLSPFFPPLPSFIPFLFFFFLFLRQTNPSPLPLLGARLGSSGAPQRAAGLCWGAQPRARLVPSWGGGTHTGTRGHGGCRSPEGPAPTTASATPGAVSPSRARPRGDPTAAPGPSASLGARCSPSPPAQTLRRGGTSRPGASLQTNLGRSEFILSAPSLLPSLPLPLPPSLHPSLLPGHSLRGGAWRAGPGYPRRQPPSSPP